MYELLSLAFPPLPSHLDVSLFSKINSFFVGSLIRPKVVRSVHFCPATKKTMERRYTDMTSLNAYPSVSSYPTKDEDGNPLETEYGLSVYKDHQTFTIQVLLYFQSWLYQWGGGQSVVTSPLERSFQKWLAWPCRCIVLPCISTFHFTFFHFWL